MFTQIQKPYLTPILESSVDSRLELNRLMATAVVNHQFRSTLLSDPEKALEEGYLGTPFYLANEDRDLLFSIRAESLQDLAQQLLVHFNQQSFSAKHVSLVT